MFAFIGSPIKYFTKYNIEKIIDKIKDQYEKPSCVKEELGCLYSGSSLDFVCKNCIEWQTSKAIIKIIKEMIND